MLVECMNFKKLERYLRVSLLGPGPRLMRKIIYRAAISQRLRNTYLDYVVQVVQTPFFRLYNAKFILGTKMKSAHHIK